MIDFNITQLDTDMGYVRRGWLYKVVLYFFTTSAYSVTM